MRCGQFCYGIAERVSDYHLSLAVFCATASAAAIIILEPNHWYFAIIIAPLLGWIGPFAIIMPIFCIEGVCYCLLHPKESYRTIFHILSFFAFLVCSVIISLGMVRFCAARFAKPDPNTWEYAYVSESPNAHRYHYSEQCKALSRTVYDIEELSVDEAEFYEYEPCGICLKESTRRRWDGVVGFLAFPVGWLLYWLIIKVECVCKKYKLRNPIVRR